MFDIKNYERQHNLAVDMCAACILHHRRFKKPLKAILLHPKYFEIFKLWVKKNIGGQQAEERQFQFDGVNIEKGSYLQPKSLHVEFWEGNMAKA